MTDAEIKHVFDLDVFSVPFDEVRGFAIVQKANLSLLILRMEDLNRCLEPALAEFLGIDPGRIKICASNEGDVKWYAGAIRQVKKTYRLPADVVEKMLATRFVRHFYANDVDRLRERWTRPPAAS